MKERKFIVTIRAATDTDVYNIQEAVLDELNRSREPQLTSEDVDVELIEDHGGRSVHPGHIQELYYTTLEAA